MSKKTLKVQQVKVGTGKDGDKYVSIKGKCTKSKKVEWYTYFGGDLVGKIWKNGTIQVIYEKKGQYRNIDKYKVKDAGEKPSGGSGGPGGQGGGSGFKTSYSNTKEGFDAKQSSITRQVALKEAVNLIIGIKSSSKAKVEKIGKEALPIAESFYSWLQKLDTKTKDADDSDDEDDNDLDNDDSDDKDDEDDDNDLDDKDDDDSDDDDDDDFDDLDDDD